MSKNLLSCCLGGALSAEHISRRCHFWLVSILQSNVVIQPLTYLVAQSLIKKRRDLRFILGHMIFFLGPTGMFFTPFSAVGSFRLFYIFLTLLVVLEVFRKKTQKEISAFALLVLIGTLLLASAGLGLIAYNPEIKGLANNPVIRAIVIINLLFGSYFLACALIRLAKDTEITDFLDRSLKGFIVVFFAGLVLYIGAITGLLPPEVYTRVVSLEQRGYGYLRLSPGTYPNEFGVLCSFFSCYCVLLYSFKRSFGTFLLSLCFAAGVFLTSTRTAYLTLVVGFFVIFVMRKSFFFRIELLAISAFSAALIVSFLQFVGFDITAVIRIGIDAATNVNSGSAATRYTAWEGAVEGLGDKPAFGTGFESPGVQFLHNLPLQMTYGLGLVGIAVFLLLLVVFFTFVSRQRKKTVWYSSKSEVSRFRGILALLAFHVFLFGLTNHNQSHFLTWLLFTLSIFAIRTSAAVHKENPVSSASTNVRMAHRRLHAWNTSSARF